jgi:toxin-antitoxin system PIN domain toxin
MLVDANLLLYAVDETSPQHQPARKWLEAALNGTRRVGLPWVTLLAFVRIGTHPRASTDPLSAEQAWGHVESWLAQEIAWIPRETERHAEVLADLIIRYGLRGNLVTDAQLAALALTHGLSVCSADTDFARFTEVAWVNPLMLA